MVIPLFRTLTSIQWALKSKNSHGFKVIISQIILSCLKSNLTWSFASYCIVCLLVRQLPCTTKVQKSYAVYKRIKPARLVQKCFKTSILRLISLLHGTNFFRCTRFFPRCSNAVFCIFGRFTRPFRQN